MDKQIEVYNKKKFITIPLNAKFPYIKNWNNFTKPVHVPNGKNVGILTGKSSGITVLDIDNGNEGLKTWNIISKLYPNIITPTCKTASGSIHLYFKYNKNLPTTIRLKVRDKKIGWDVLNDNSQVVAPPSLGIHNKKYKWIMGLDHPIVEMPEWLLLFIKINHK